MRKLALALAAAATLGLAAPALVADAEAASGRVQLARADVKMVTTKHRRGVHKRVVVRRHAVRHGWRHWRPHRVSHTVVVRRPNGVVIKKKIIRR